MNCRLILTVGLVLVSALAREGDAEVTNEADLLIDIDGYQSHVPRIQYENRVLLSIGGLTVRLRRAKPADGVLVLPPGGHAGRVVVERAGEVVLDVPHDEPGSFYEPIARVFGPDLFVLTYEDVPPTDDEENLIGTRLQAVVYRLPVSGAKTVDVHRFVFRSIAIADDPSRIARYELLENPLGGKPHLLLMEYKNEMPELTISPGSVRCLRSYALQGDEWQRISHDVSDDPSE